MTPKEKAIQLLKKVDDCVCGDINDHNKKDMAIIIVDEILGLGFLTGGHDHERVKESQLWYWLEVKLEIENS